MPFLFRGDRARTGEPGEPGPTGATGPVGPASTVPGPVGATGDTGPAGSAASITVGTTTTGAAGTNASVVNAGTTSAAVLNFTIPRGATGATGAASTVPGPQGPPGPPAVSRAAIVTTNTAGVATWVYATPFPAGVTPIISATAQQAAGVIAEVQITAVSNTQCSILVTRTAAITVALLGLTILQIAGAASTQVHLSATAPG